jgi:hypothetical protein
MIHSKNGNTLILSLSHTGHLEIVLSSFKLRTDANNIDDIIDEAHQKHDSHIKKCFCLS